MGSLLAGAGSAGIATAPSAGRAAGEDMGGIRRVLIAKALKSRESPGTTTRKPRLLPSHRFLFDLWFL
jgi:hypothetical protein